MKKIVAFLSLLSFQGSMLASTAAPALATSIPAVDLAGRRAECSFGFFQASLDKPVSERLSLGANLTSDFFSGEAHIRANLRLGGEERGLSYGAGLVYRYLSQESGVAHFLQPALTLAYPVLPNLRIRALVGPSIGLRDGRIRFGAPDADLTSSVLSALELAWRVQPAFELTAGGQSVLGARLIF